MLYAAMIVVIIFVENFGAMNSFSEIKLETLNGVHIEKNCCTCPSAFIFPPHLCTLKAPGL